MEHPLSGVSSISGFYCPRFVPSDESGFFSGRIAVLVGQFHPRRPLTTPACPCFYFSAPWFCPLSCLAVTFPVNGVVPEPRKPSARLVWRSPSRQPFSQPCHRRVHRPFRICRQAPAGFGITGPSVRMHVTAIGSFPGKSVFDRAAGPCESQLEDTAGPFVYGGDAGLPDGEANKSLVW